MQRIKDLNGNIIDGLFRDETGAIIVNDSKNYRKYQTETTRLQEINRLNSKIESLEQMVMQLITKLENK
jgi:hypothetical protein